MIYLDVVHFSPQCVHLVAALLQCGTVTEHSSVRLHVLYKHNITINLTILEDFKIFLREISRDHLTSLLRGVLTSDLV